MDILDRKLVNCTFTTLNQGTGSFKEHLPRKSHITPDFPLLGQSSLVTPSFYYVIKYTLTQELFAVA
jgi:hypothetical protein